MSSDFFFGNDLIQVSIILLLIIVTFSLSGYFFLMDIKMMTMMCLYLFEWLLAFPSTDGPFFVLLDSMSSSHDDDDVYAHDDDDDGHYHGNSHSRVRCKIVHSDRGT